MNIFQKLKTVHFIIMEGGGIRLTRYKRKTRTEKCTVIKKIYTRRDTQAKSKTYVLIRRLGLHLYLCFYLIYTNIMHLLNTFGQLTHRFYVFKC